MIEFHEKNGFFFKFCPHLCSVNEQKLSQELSSKNGLICTVVYKEQKQNHFHQNNVHM